jgi:L-ascorbate metabolism protein UlaG (beta-lactamase superfamily)
VPAGEAQRKARACAKRDRERIQNGFLKMKKWLFRVGGVMAVGCFLPIVFILMGETDSAMVTKFIQNQNLKTMKKVWKGVPVDQKGRFVNTEFPFLPSTIDLLKWKLGPNPQAAEKRTETFQLTIQDPTAFLIGDKDGILWLGHASVFIRLSGKSILIDPVFGDPSYITRYFKLDSPIEKIKNVDYVLITHDHLDHMDESTIRAISLKFPNAKFLAGLESEDLLNEWVGGEDRVQTAGWYQQFLVDEKDLQITFVPVRHWSRRGVFDTNKRLWGGFVVQGGGKTIYHGGDSGYGSHYAEMAEVFPNIDYFIIGIGSYEPRWIMKVNHNNPEDAVQAFVDSKAKFLVPMHYATFDMSDEPPSEPLRRLMQKAMEANLNESVKPLDVHESLVFGDAGSESNIRRASRAGKLKREL